MGALKSTETNVIKSWFTDNVITMYGVPEELVSDLGVQFTSNEFETYLKNAQIRHCKTAPYTPSTNGLVERYNRSLLNALRCFTQEEPVLWPEYLQSCAFAYRASKNVSTGFSPFELVQARSPRIGLHVDPVTCQDSDELVHDTRRLAEKIRGSARLNLVKSQKASKGYYDKKNQVTDCNLKCGDRVYWKRPPPFNKEVQGG